MVGVSCSFLFKKALFTTSGKFEFRKYDRMIVFASAESLHCSFFNALFISDYLTDSFVLHLTSFSAFTLFFYIYIYVFLGDMSQEAGPALFLKLNYCGWGSGQILQPPCFR